MAASSPTGGKKQWVLLDISPKGLDPSKLVSDCRRHVGGGRVMEDCPTEYLSFFSPDTGEVGNAAKMMLIVNMVQGSFMATIAEGLTLAQVTGQSQQTLLDILNQGQLASIFLDQKCQSKVLLSCPPSSLGL